MATADFKINTSVQADRGYDATTSEAITLTLENAPSVDVYKVVYSVVIASDGAPTITFSPGSGQPATPTGNVTFTTTGSGFHSYLIQCQVNDGKRQTDRGLVVDAGYTKQRMIVIRGALTNLRKTVPAETTQYGSDGWSVALNELADAVENGSVGGISTSEPIVTNGAAPTIPNATNLQAVTATVAVASTTVQPLASRLNPSTNDTVLDVFSLRRSTTHASNGTTGIGARMFVELEDSAGNVDTAAQHVWDYLDATSTSEDARYTIRLQVAGGLTDVLSLRGTTIRVPALAGGGSRVVTVDNNGDFGAAAASGLDANAHVLEDAATALGANGVPMRAAPSTVGFVGVACAPISLTYKAAAAGGGVVEGLRVKHQVGAGSPGTGGEGVRIALSVPDNAGADTVGATWRTESTSILLSVNTKAVWATVNAGSLTDWMTLSSTGVLSVVTGIQAPSLDTASAGVLTLGGTNATAIAASSLKITGLADGSSSSDAAAFGQIASGVNAAVSGTSGKVPKFTGTNAIGNSTISDDGTNVSITGSFTAGTGGFIGVSIDRATSGTFTLGSNITTVAGTAVAMTGIASVDNSAGTFDLGANTTAQNVGKASTTWAIRGAATVAETLGVSGVVTFTGTAVGSTQTRGVTITNTTVSGTQYTRQHGFTAFYSDGTQWNFGSRLEPVSAAHARLIWYYGSGSGVPSSEILRLDSQDDNFGALVRAPVFAASNTGGYRFDNANNRGGLKYDSGSDYIYLESYNGKDLRLRTGADSGGSGGTDRLTVTTTGAMTFTHAASAVTRKQHGTAGVNYTDLTGTAVTVTASGTGTLYTIATVSNSYVDVEVRGFAYHVGTVGNVRAFGVRCAFKNIAGTVTDGTQENIRTPDDLGTAWGTPPTVMLGHSGTDILATGAAAGATDTRFIITEVKWFVGTTSA